MYEKHEFMPPLLSLVDCSLNIRLEHSSNAPLLTDERENEKIHQH